MHLRNSYKIVKICHFFFELEGILFPKHLFSKVDNESELSKEIYIFLPLADKDFILITRFTSSDTYIVLYYRQTLGLSFSCSEITAIFKNSPAEMQIFSYFEVCFIIPGGIFIEHNCDFNNDEEPCGILHVVESELTQNIAEGGGGGAIHYKSQEGVKFTCNGGSTSENAAPCSSWQDNQAIMDGYGPIVATGGQKLFLSTDSYIVNHLSGAPVEIRVSILDAYNQTVTGGVPEAQTLTSINSPENIARSQTKVSTIYGEAVFSNLQVLRMNLASHCVVCLWSVRLIGNQITFFKETFDCLQAGKLLRNSCKVQLLCV